MSQSFQIDNPVPAYSGCPKRLLIARIESLQNGNGFCTVDNVRRAAEWSDISVTDEHTTADSVWNRMVFYSMVQDATKGLTHSFGSSWRLWSQSVPQRGAINWHPLHHGSSIPARDELSVTDGTFWGKASFYWSDYFQSSGSLMPLAATPLSGVYAEAGVVDPSSTMLVSSPDFAWLSLIIRAMGRIDTSQWFRRGEKLPIPKPLKQRFADGDTSVVCEDSDCSDRIEEVYLMDERGVVTGYTVPKVFPDS